MDHMHLVLPTSVVPIRIVLDKPLCDKDLLWLCEQNEVFHVEREPDGTLLARKIGGFIAGSIAAKLQGRLWDWADADGRGKPFSNCGFILKDGSMRGPRLAWVSSERLNTLKDGEHEGFPPLCPEFVIEVLSHSYSLPELQAKMRAWIANGVDVAWLIDPSRKAVEVYRPGREVEVFKGTGPVQGEGPVAGFVLELGKVWR
jgi:Uma2 family endonuclease